MIIGSKEHYEMLKSFEKAYKYLRLVKENKSLWEKGQIYESGEANTLYKAFELGYATGRLNYLNGGEAE